MHLTVLRGKGAMVPTGVRGVIAKTTSTSIDIVTEDYNDEEMEEPLRLDQVIIDPFFFILSHCTCC